ncbi:S-adenosyl-L-methionine-dependent methyltransferase [Thozetella sp. PMI_491]|nr:S-adenosyl-L-methionine-dependent methyltransferase [Thozetella sp. PMI_491]
MAEDARNTYLPGHKPSQVKHHEWRTIENSCAYLLPVLHELHTANPSLKLLDVGAGSGTITAGLAQLIQPSGHVTATDLSEAILTRARDLMAARGDVDMDRIAFQQGDAYHLPFPDDTFDVTHCHQMLAHLRDPADALREMIRVTRPGGVVAAREADISTMCAWPADPILLQFHEFTKAMHCSAGGSSTAGRQLLSWALKAGAKRDQITASFGARCYSSPEDKKMCAGAMIERVLRGEMGKKGMELGLIKEGDAEQFAKAWEDWMNSDDAIHASMNGEVIIRK